MRSTQGFRQGDLNRSRAPRPARVPKIPFVDLFTDGRAIGTVLLGLILLLGFATTTVAVLQTPTLLLRGLEYSAGDVIGYLVGVFSIMSVCGMGLSGKLVDRFGPAGALAPAFICGAALLASLGYVATSPLERTVVMGLLGFAVPMGAGGTIALTAMFYPTAMRSAGTGWAMGLGRFGQVLSPLVIGLMIALAWAPTSIFVAMADGAAARRGLCRCCTRHSHIRAPRCRARFRRPAARHRRWERWIDAAFSQRAGGAVAAVRVARVSARARAAAGAACRNALSRSAHRVARPRGSVGSAMPRSSASRRVIAGPKGRSMSATAAICCGATYRTTASCAGRKTTGM